MNAHAEKNGSVRPTAGVNPTGSPGLDVLLANESRIEWMQPNSCGTKTSDDSKSFKYGPSDLLSDHPMPMRGIPFAPHRSNTMVIPSHRITTCQHHSDVVLQSHSISLMRFNLTCSLDFFPCLTRTVCFTSLTNDCIVTCRAFFRLYCWRVRSFRFFLASDDYYWVTIADESNCEEACGVGELDSCCCEAVENNLDLNSIIIALISSLKLFIIACRAPIVTNASAAATWFVGMLNDRMT